MKAPRVQAEAVTCQMEYVGCVSDWIVSGVHERLMALREDYSATGFATATWPDGRQETQCPWCRQTPEQGHLGDGDCDWLVIDELLRSAEQAVAALQLARQERDEQAEAVTCQMEYVAEYRARLAAQDAVLQGLEEQIREKLPKGDGRWEPLAAGAASRPSVCEICRDIEGLTDSVATICADHYARAVQGEADAQNALRDGWGPEDTALLHELCMTLMQDCWFHDVLPGDVLARIQTYLARHRASGQTGATS